MIITIMIITNRHLTIIIIVITIIIIITIKDLSWMQALGGWYYSGLIFGAMAMLWSVLLSTKALFVTKNYHEAYLNVVCILQ